MRIGNKLAFLSLVSILCIYIITSAKSKSIILRTKNKATDSNFIYNDTTITLFDDKSYKLNIHTFDGDANESGYNTLLTFEHIQNGKTKQLLKDSLYCLNYAPNVQLVDMNNDKVDDILITYDMSGGNSNMMYHLYICDVKNHELIHIKGFEDIYNPKLNNKYNIIESLVLSGTDYFTFHRITAQNKLIDLGHSFNINKLEQDSGKMKKRYNNAIRQILHEHKKS